MTASPNRTYLLERVDDAAVVQLYADGFAALSLRDKMLVWHLYLAALAGRDIYYDQRYAHNLEMRGAARGDPDARQAVDPAVLAEIRRYTKLFWINTGPYNNLTARKFLLRLTRAELAGAVRAAAGARRALSAARGRVARIAGRSAGAAVLRSAGRPDRHQQDAGPGPRHSRGERQQSVRRRDDERPRAVRRSGTGSIRGW